MRTILVHLLCLWEDLYGRPSPDQRPEALAQGAADGARRCLSALDALAADGRLVVVPDRGSFRSEIDTAHRETRREIGGAARGAYQGVIRRCAERWTVVEPQAWPAGGPVADLGGGDCLPLSGRRPAARDVIATLAAQWAALPAEERGELAVVSSRTSLLSLVAVGVTVIRDLRQDGAAWTWRTLHPAEVASEYGDPRSFAEIAALESLPRIEKEPGKLSPGLGWDTARLLVDGGERTQKGKPPVRYAGHGSALAVVEMAAAQAADSRLGGTTGPQMAQLRAAATSGGAGILRALAVQAMRSDAPVPQLFGGALTQAEIDGGAPLHGAGVVVTEATAAREAAHTEGADVAPQSLQAPAEAPPPERAHQGGTSLPGPGDRSPAHPRPSPSPERLDATGEGAAEGLPAGTYHELRHAPERSPVERDAVEAMREHLAQPTTAPQARQEPPAAPQSTSAPPAPQRAATAQQSITATKETALIQDPAPAVIPEAIVEATPQPETPPAALAVRAPEPAPEAPLAVYDPSDARWSMALQPQSGRAAYALAERLAASVYYRGKAPADIAAIILMGRERGVSAMLALASMHVIDGKVEMSADLIAALVLRSGKAKRFACVESTDESAVYEVQRIDDPAPMRISFTRKDAERRGLWGKKQWQQMPDVMLAHRACTKAARLKFPDVTTGLYGTGEIGETRSDAA